MIILDIDDDNPVKKKRVKNIDSRFTKSGRLENVMGFHRWQKKCMSQDERIFPISDMEKVIPVVVTRNYDKHIIVFR